MHSFDLSQALESSPESDEMEMEHCLPEAEVDDVLNFYTGLSLEVSKQPHSMRHVATLVVALNKMKVAFTSRSSEFTDVQLFSIIMENLEDESLIEKVQYHSVCGAKRRIFQRVGSVRSFTLCDISQKDVVKPSEALELQALTVKGGEDDKKVRFRLSQYVSPSVTPAQVQPVVLSIANTNWNISCCMRGGTAVLLLEDCCEEKLSIINSDGDMARFLFYRKTTGISLITFESVKYPGWVISTSVEERKRVEMCKEDTAARFTTFKDN